MNKKSDVWNTSNDQAPKGHNPKTREELGITGMESEFPAGELSMLKRCYRGLFDSDIANEFKLANK